MIIKNKRIGNLEFRKATYLLPDNKLPEHISYHIDYWCPNAYYGKESDFIKEGDWYVYPDNPYHRVHRDCFKHPQSCFAIASFDWDKEGYYELHFIGDRPLEITKEEREAFWKLLEYGYKQLNKENNEESEE